jgi:hypothetical protein
MDIPTYKFQVYTCGCGYISTHAGNANRHKKASCGHIVTNEVKEFVNKDFLKLERPSDFILKECLQREKILTDEIEKNNHRIAQLQNANERLKISLTRMASVVDNVDIEDELDGTPHIGIIYFITEKDVEDRGKIGRTKNTNIKKLKSRYSTFGNPNILCYLSTDIIEDENALKKLMRDAGCMESNKEMISNCDVAMRVFYEFVTSKLTWNI